MARKDQNTSIIVSKGNTQADIGQALAETANALKVSDTASAMRMIAPLDDSGITPFDLFCHKYQVDRRSQVIGAHQIISAIQGGPTDLLQGLYQQQRLAQYEASRTKWDIIKEKVTNRLKSPFRSIRDSVKSLGNFSSFEPNDRW